MCEPVQTIDSPEQAGAAAFAGISRQAVSPGLYSAPFPNAQRITSSPVQTALEVVLMCGNGASGIGNQELLCWSYTAPSVLGIALRVTPWLPPEMIRYRPVHRTIGLKR